MRMISSSITLPPLLCQGNVTKLFIGGFDEIEAQKEDMKHMWLTLDMSSGLELHPLLTESYGTPHDYRELVVIDMTPP